ncbi:hypothetical protein ACFL35_17575, partial [Candidatus Riflebacteria bacterium]
PALGSKAMGILLFIAENKIVCGFNPVNFPSLKMRIRQLSVRGKILRPAFRASPRQLPNLDL